MRRNLWRHRASEDAEGALRPRRVWPVLLVMGLLAVLIAGGLARWVGGGRGAPVAGPEARPSTSSAPSPGSTGPGAAAAPTAPASSERELAERFFSRYVAADGRVVRHDQGGDTVSEGQSYALLLAAAVHDEEVFDRVWTWTTTHLQRPDGLLSWTWRNQAVLDANSASDADVDAAHALVVAGSVFDRPDLRAAGTTLGAAILDHETQQTSLGRVLLAGQWANQSPYQVNPSYSSPTAYALLGTATGDPRWGELARGDRAVVHQLLEESPLPPDWAQVKDDGSVDAMPPPGGGQVGFGLDAQRIAIRYAASCSREDRGVAAAIGRTLPTGPGQVRGIYDLGGSPRVPWQHPVALVAAAATTSLAGRTTASDELLGEASALDARSTTYYGAAWTALGTRFVADRASLGIHCAKETS